jgi:hypothetical protein
VELIVCYNATKPISRSPSSVTETARCLLSCTVSAQCDWSCLTSACALHDFHIAQPTLLFCHRQPNFETIDSRPTPKLKNHAFVGLFMNLTLLAQRSTCFAAFFVGVGVDINWQRTFSRPFQRQSEQNAVSGYCSPWSSAHTVRTKWHVLCSLV